MRTFSRFFIGSLAVALFSFAWVAAFAQTSGTGLFLDVPSGEFENIVHVRVMAPPELPGPVRLFLGPPQIFIGELERSTSDLGRWEYDWDTRQTPNGAYQLTARTLNSIEISRPIVIHNISTSQSSGSTPPPTPLPTTQPPPPPPTITAPPPPLPAASTQTSRPVVAEMSQSGVVRGFLDIRISTENAQGIELFAGKLSEGKGHSIGRAEHAPLNPNLWYFRFDTREHPNGLYGIGAKVVTTDGLFWAQIAEITILNPSTLPTETRPTTTFAKPPPPPRPLPELRANKPAPIPDVEKIERNTKPLTETEEDAIKRRIRDNVSSFTKTIEAIDDRPKETTKLQDVDGDGISDYDEKNIYKTNPSLRDSDKDGISDSVELLSNQDPNNTAVTTITYENPKEAGTPRPEILAVSDIAPILITEPNGTQSIDKVTLTGQAPPNSLVTLYIFSTPFVVTVKTNSEGAWTYTFDKELADGDHEVYATITDSKGSVLAKSDPLPFVKTANAISRAPIVAQTTYAKPSIYGKHPTSFIVALVASTIGIALVIIGFVVRRRRIETVLPPQ